MGDGYIQSSAQVRQLAMKTNVWVEVEWLVLTSNYCGTAPLPVSEYLLNTLVPSPSSSASS